MFVRVVSSQNDFRTLKISFACGGFFFLKQGTIWNRTRFSLLQRYRVDDGGGGGGSVASRWSVFLIFPSPAPFKRWD